MNKAYTLHFAKQVAKEIKALTSKEQEKLKDALRHLTHDPISLGKKLVGYDGLYRYRVGDYRIIYALEHGKLLIIVLAYMKRKENYRQLATLEKRLKELLIQLTKL
ncbi:MAG: type II toxin-antitoxin system RelE/ParE family toxin [Deinococcales bacterium]